MSFFDLVRPVSLVSGIKSLWDQVPVRPGLIYCINSHTV